MFNWRTVLLALVLLALLPMVDPDNGTGAFEGFAYKQLFFEPIVGSCLFTTAAPALINRLGLVPVLAIADGLLVFWLAVGYLLVQHILGLITIHRKDRLAQARTQQMAFVEELETSRCGHKPEYLCINHKFS